MPSREQFLQSLQEIESEGKTRKQSDSRSSFLEGLTAKGLDAVLFGGADELTAGVIGGYDYLLGSGNFGKTYDTALKTARQPLKEFEQDYPKTSLAIDIGSLALPIGGLAHTGYKAYKAVKGGHAAAPRVAQVAKSVGLGSVVGGATGFLSGEGIEGRTKGAIFGAGIGGVTGGAADYVTQLAGGAWRRLKGIDLKSIADDPVQRNLLLSFIGHEDVLKDAPKALERYRNYKSEGINIPPAAVLAEMGDHSLLSIQDFLQNNGSTADRFKYFDKQVLEKDLLDYFDKARQNISDVSSVDVAGRNLVEGANDVKFALKKERSNIVEPLYDKAKVENRTEIVDELGLNPNTEYDDILERIADEIATSKGRDKGEKYFTEETSRPTDPDLVNRMKDFGINPEGKTKEQLQEEIAGLYIPEFTNYAHDPEAGHYLQRTQKRRLARTIDGAESLKDPKVKELLKAARKEFSSTLYDLKLENIPDNSVALLHHAKAAAYDKASAARLDSKGSLGHEYTSVAKKIEADLERDELYAAANEIFREISPPVNRFDESVLSEIAKQKPDGQYIIKDAEKAPEKLLNVTPEEAKYIKSKLPQKTIDDAIGGYMYTLRKRDDRIVGIFGDIKKKDKVLKQLLEPKKYLELKQSEKIFDMSALGRTGTGSRTQMRTKIGEDLKDIEADFIRNLLNHNRGGWVKNLIQMIGGRSKIDQELLKSENLDKIYEFVMTEKGLHQISILAKKSPEYLNNRYVIKQLGKAANVYAAQESARQLTAKEKKKQEVPTNIRQFLGVPTKSNQNKQDYIPGKVLDLGTIYQGEN